MPYLIPRVVRRVSPTITEIAWNDGHASSYPSWYLRERCPCAACVEEFTGERKVAPGSIPASVERLDVGAVGNYALGFRWSDGHATGIYTFDYLRQLCPCPQCLPDGLPEPSPAALEPGAFEV